MKKIKVLSLVLAVAMFACLLIPAMSVSAAGTAYTFYVSEEGNDSRDGKTEENAFATVAKAMTAAEAITFVEGDTVKIIVSGSVLAGPESGTGSQSFIAIGNPNGGEVNGGQHTLVVKGADNKGVLNADGSLKLIPVIFEGKDSNAKLEFNAKSYTAARKWIPNQVTYKNITLHALCREASAITASEPDTLTLQAVYGITLDNVKFTSTTGNTKFIFAATTVFGDPVKPLTNLGGKLSNFVKLYNGDYTGIEVTTIWSHASGALSNKTETNAPTIVVGSGAKLGTLDVLARDMNTAVPGGIKVTVENGGEVATLNAYKSDLTKFDTEISITLENGSTVGTLNATGTNVTVTDNRTAGGSTPATADAGQIVLFSFVAIAALAGVVVLKKTRA